MRTNRQAGFAPLELIVVVAVTALIVAAAVLYIVRQQAVGQTTTANTTSHTTPTSPTPNPGTQPSSPDTQVAIVGSAKDCVQMLDAAYKPNVPPTPQNDPGAFISLTLTRATLQSVNLTNGIITTTNGEGTTNDSGWGTTMPVVYDSQCNKIKLSDLKAGDLLNLYLTNNTTPSQLFFIQKISG